MFKIFRLTILVLLPQKPLKNQDISVFL